MSKTEEIIGFLYLNMLIMTIIYVQEGSMVCGGLKWMTVQDAVISIVHQLPKSDTYSFTSRK